MSHLGQNRKSSMRANVFRFALRADIAQRSRHVRFAPFARLRLQQNILSRFSAGRLADDLNSTLDRIEVEHLRYLLSASAVGNFIPIVSHRLPQYPWPGLGAIGTIAGR